MLKYTVQVEGMGCTMCEGHINTAIRNAFDPKKVTSSHTKKHTIIISEQELNEQEILDTINGTGYDALSVKKESYEKKGIFGRFFG